MARIDHACRSCGGAGEWAAECCNGSGGCSCGGRPVRMGRCAPCGGSGTRDFPGYDEMANVRAIRGFGFLGTGPRPYGDGSATDSIPRWGGAKA